jgi:hypothetical protein
MAVMPFARQSIQLGNQQHGPMFVACRKGCSKLWAVVLAGALNIGEACKNAFPASVQEDMDGLLGLQPQPALALAVGGHAKVRDVAAVVHTPEYSRMERGHKLQTTVGELSREGLHVVDGPHHQGFTTVTDS